MEVIDFKDVKISFFMPRCKGKEVLDLGVVQHEREKYKYGTWLHRAIKSTSKELTGLDIDEDGVKYLNENNYNVVYEDAQDFNLNKQFDVVCAGDIIEHLDNISGFLTSIKKHMKTDGVLLLSTPNPFWWRTSLTVLLSKNARPHKQHTCWFCEATLKQVLERFNMEIIETSYGTVYDLSRVKQRMTKYINMFLPLPNRIKHNTIMISARVKQ